MAIRLAVGLGANLGARERSLLAAASALERIPGLEPVALSSAYETEAVGPVQPPFLNAALLATSSLGPLEVLAALQGVEAALGRRRGLRFGPRVIDLDLLVVEGRSERHGRRLVLPHPRLRGRAFALAPLVEVWPEARDPVRGELYAEVLGRLDRSGVGAPRPLPARVPRRRLGLAAEAGFELSAASLEGLFERAAMALVATTVDRRRVTERARRDVEARGGSLAELLVAVLSELVRLLAGERFAPRRASVLVLEPGLCRLAVYGEPLRGADQLRTPVEGVRQGSATVEPAAGGRHRARVVLDLRAAGPAEGSGRRAARPI